MALTIRTNALGARAGKSDFSARIAQSFERLASGLRINSAKDDAAGLAISERMDSLRRALDQARRNAADGTSLAQTVEAGTAEMNTILIRLRELAIQAANDSNSSSDRKALHNEAQQLVRSLDQIASSTEFNGRKILDGSTSVFDFQTGAKNSKDDSIQVSLKGHRASQLGFLATHQGHFEEIDTLLGGQEVGIVGNGDVVINGITVGSTEAYAAEVKHTPSNSQVGSAYAKAKAINAANAGVTAVAQKYVETYAFASTTVTYMLVINDVIIFSASNGASVDDLIQKINAKADKTGIKAIKPSDLSFALVSEDGRNINSGVTHPAQWTTLLSAGRGGMDFKSQKAFSVTTAPGVSGYGGAQLIGIGNGVEKTPLSTSTTSA